MKPELTKEEEINNAIEDVRAALIRKVEVESKLIQISHEKTASHYALQKAKERLSSLEVSL